MAEFEHSLIKERQREGIALSKAAGKYKGRKASLASEQIDSIRSRYSTGEQITRLAREFAVFRQTVYNYVYTQIA